MSEKWFGIDQFNGDTETFDTLEEAQKWAKDIISDIDAGEGWPEEILDGAIKIGKIMYESSMTNKRDVPLDEDGEPENSDFDFYCDCEMVEIENINEEEKWIKNPKK